MNNTLGRVIAAVLFLSLVTGCSKQAETVIIEEEHRIQRDELISTPNTDTNQFRTINNSDSSHVGEVEVICHNCQAHFKLSQQIRKLSMKGDAIVDCPVCHKDYLKN